MGRGAETGSGLLVGRRRRHGERRSSQFDAMQRLVERIAIGDDGAVLEGIKHLDGTDAASERVGEATRHRLLDWMAPSEAPLPSEDSVLLETLDPEMRALAESARRGIPGTEWALGELQPKLAAAMFDPAISGPRTEWMIGEWLPQALRGTGAKPERDRKTIAAALAEMHARRGVSNPRNETVFVALLGDAAKRRSKKRWGGSSRGRTVQEYRNKLWDELELDFGQEFDASERRHRDRLTTQFNMLDSPPTTALAARQLADEALLQDTHQRLLDVLVIDRGCGDKTLLDLARDIHERGELSESDRRRVANVELPYLAFRDAIAAAHDRAAAAGPEHLGTQTHVHLLACELRERADALAVALAG